MSDLPRQLLGVHRPARDTVLKRLGRQGVNGSKAGEGTDRSFFFVRVLRVMKCSHGCIGNKRLHDYGVRQR